MPNRRVGALAAALCLWAGSTYPEQARFVSELAWTVDNPSFGGLSGLEVSEDGQSFVAISDRGSSIRGTLRRKNGVISSVEMVEITGMQIDPIPAASGRIFDAEGLASLPDGSHFVSFEGVHRVDLYDTFTASPTRLAPPTIPEGLYENGGLEALAIDTSGRLFAIPENKRRRIPDYPVLVYQNDIWTTPFRILGVDGMRPVGADFGPDGALYLLERSFHGIFGFSSRVRRFDPGSTGVVTGDVLFHTPPGTHDNLEGIAVWSDEDGALRLTMVSDNNFSVFQRTEFVEYRLTP